MRCHVTEAQQLGDVPTPPSLGVMGDHLLVASFDGTWHGQWFELSDLDPVTGLFEIGSGRGTEPTWIEAPDALHTVLELAFDARELSEVPRNETVTWVRITPPSSVAVDKRRVPLPSSEACTSCAYISATIPTIATVAGLRSGVSLIPAECEEDLGNQIRLHLFDEEGVTGRVSWTPPCGRTPNPPDAMTKYTLIALDGGDIGVLFRTGWGVPSAIQYLRTNVAGEVLTGPVEAGETAPFNHGNLQPVAARIDDRIFFVDPTDHPDECSVLRWTSDDGVDRGELRWQLPCTSDDSIWTETVQLQALGDYLSIVWNERVAGRNLQVTAGDVPYQAIYAALLTRDGLLASEPVRVSEANTTAIPLRSPEEIDALVVGLDPEEAEAVRELLDAPYYIDDLVVRSAAANSSSIVVGWVDERRDAPGTYARRMTCEPL